jgi:uncharacterized tellurite resistance protein B-like protein
MRSYPPNSPEAAARIVALAMLADGHLSNTEFDVLERLNAYNRFGLAPAQWDSVIEACCEDLLANNHLSWDQTCRVDERTLAQVLSEVHDPALRRDVVSVCSAVVEADDYVTDGEWFVLSAAVRQWGLEVEMFRAVSAAVPGDRADM